MLTREMILNAIEEDEYTAYGLRYDNNNYSVGDYCENSHEWFQDVWNVPNYEELSDEELEAIYCEDLGCYDAGELDGTCTIQVTADNVDSVLKRMNIYKNCGNDLILVGGSSAEEGNDVEEIIIRNAVVIAK